MATVTVQTPPPIPHVTNLQYNQNSTLYIAEYFQMMRDRLTDDGIACAWIPMSSISPESFRTLLRTFQYVNPHATLWLMNEMPTYFGILIGTQGQPDRTEAGVGS